ncbi:MAG: formate dehydrogenase [Alphaproteobacteria bacterium]|nr:formate dehydrogenase [Alphaproteobacteria bacterium]
MKKDKTTAETDRRGFLKLAGAGVVGTGAVAASTVIVTEAEAAEPAQSQGYRETEHVRRYYELAKFM